MIRIVNQNNVASMCISGNNPHLMEVDGAYGSKLDDPDVGYATGTSYECENKG